MSDEELKPCPFCGMDWLEVHVKGSERGPAYQVVCSECGASGPVAEREREVAMTAWNTHHTTFDPPYGKPHNQQTYGKPHSAPPQEGWVMVPRQLTYEQQDRLARQWGYTDEETVETYGALVDMLSAAPQHGDG